MNLTNPNGQPVNLQPGAWYTLTPDNDEDLPVPIKGLRIENVAQGDTLHFVDDGGNEHTWTLAAHEWGYHPIQIKKIFVQDTTDTLVLIGAVSNPDTIS